MSAEQIAVPRREAAALVGVSTRELDRAIADGEIQVKYRGRKPLVDYSDLRDWFESLPADKPAA
jgi:excisionase family DNA binding protein